MSDVCKLHARQLSSTCYNQDKFIVHSRQSELDYHEECVRLVKLSLDLVLGRVLSVMERTEMMLETGSETVLWKVVSSAGSVAAAAAGC